MYYVVPLLAAVIGLTAINQQSANASHHSTSWEYGYHHGQESGIVGYFGLSICDEKISPKACDAGYLKGWDSTCATALSNPDAEHDIYGCPGISHAAIDKILNSDSEQFKEQDNNTAAEKAACANAHPRATRTIRNEIALPFLISTYSSVSSNISFWILPILNHRLHDRFNFLWSGALFYMYKYYLALCPILYNSIIQQFLKLLISQLYLYLCIVSFLYSGKLMHL